MNIKLLLNIVMLSTLFFAGQTPADILVVVNKDSETSTLSKYELIDLYMGRFRTYPNKRPAHLYDYDEQSGLRSQFYRQLIDKSVAEVNAFWARLLFTGRANPPVLLDGVSPLFEVLDNDMQAIGYIDEDDLGDEMKVVYRILVR